MLLRCLTATKMNIAPTNLSISVSLKLIVQLSRPDLKLKTIYTTNIYLFKVNNRNTGEICSKLTIKTPKRRCWRRSGVFIVNFEHNLRFYSCTYFLGCTEFQTTRPQTTTEHFYYKETGIKFFFTLLCFTNSDHDVSVITRLEPITTCRTITSQNL